MTIVTRHKLAWVVLIAIVARVAFLLIFGESVFFYEQTGLIHGSTAYDAYALNLLETGVYGRTAGVADSNIPPLYSYIVAAVYGVFGRGGLQIGLLHTLFDVLSIVLVYEIARRLFQQGTFFGQAIGEWVGALAGLFYALYPYLIFQNLTLNDTALFMLLMHAFVLLVVILREREQYDRVTLRIALLAGLVLGLSALTRALLPLFALFTALWFLFRLDLRESFLRLLPVAVTSVLVLVPWMIRSYNVYDQFVALALNTGPNLHHSANDMTIALFEAGYDAQWADSPPNLPQDPYEINAVLTETAIDWMATNTDRLPELLWVKFLVHWSIDITPRENPLPGQSFALADDGSLIVVDNPDAQKQDIETITLYSDSLFDRIGRPVHQLYFGTLLVLAVIGQVLTLPQWRTVSLLIFLQLSMTIMYMLFHPSTRYRVPTDPLLFTFSAYTLLVAVRALYYQRKNRYRKPA